MTVILMLAIFAIFLAIDYLRKGSRANGGRSAGSHCCFASPDADDCGWL
jgi:hypothetical protein